MKTLYLIDVSGFIFRAFYALPSLSRPDGTPVGAVYGFCNMLLKLRENILTHPEQGELFWAGVFDVSRRNFRHDIDPNYKQNRKETPEELIPQFALIREACEAFCCPVVEYPGAEADDVIATFAREGTEQGYQVVVVSSDKDLMQLYSPGVKLFDPMKQKWIQEEDIIAKFGVSANQVTDVQALAGDTSDGVKGIPGVGVKTAAEWIKKFGSLETLLANSHTITQKKKQELLKQYADDARTAKRLVSLDDRVDIHMENYVLTFPREVSEAAQTRCTQFCEVQGFSALIKRLSGLLQSANNAPMPQMMQAPNYPVITTQAQWDQTVKQIPAESEVGIALATKTIRGGQELITGAVLSWSPTGGCVLRLPEHEQRRALRHVCMQNKIIALDVKALAHYAECPKLPPAFDDVSLMAYAFLGGKMPQTLTQLFPIFLDLAFPNVADDMAGCAAANLGKLRDALQERLLQAPALQHIYEKLDQPALCAVFEMEQNGVHVDQAVLQRIGEDLDTEIRQLEQTVYMLAGTEFNLASPQQLGNVLFETLQIPAGKKHKSGQYQTDNTTLSQIAYSGDFPIIEYVLRWRRLFKLRSTYIDSLITCVDAKTHRIHSTFSLINTNTGRLASARPNLQNIPIRRSEGERIREAFTGQNDASIASFDYSQIELRLLAYMGKVEGLIQAFEGGGDIHATTASKIFHLPLDQVDAESRRKAKTVNFGILYGQSVYGLAQQLKISRKEAGTIIESYFQTYPEIQVYMEDCKNFARKHGYVETLFKRRCYIPDIHNKNATLRQFAERQAMNAPLQGTNADIIKKAMIAIPSTLPSAVRMILQIHDELLFEGPHDALLQCADPIRAVMSNILKEAGLLDVPLVVNFRVADNWAAAH